MHAPAFCIPLHPPGFSIAIILWDKLVGPGGQLSQLIAQGYQYDLHQKDPNNPTAEISIATSPSPPPPNSDFIVTKIRVRLPGSCRAASRQLCSS